MLRRNSSLTTMSLLTLAISGFVALLNAQESLPPFRSAQVGSGTNPAGDAVRADGAVGTLADSVPNEPEDAANPATGTGVAGPPPNKRGVEFFGAGDLPTAPVVVKVFHLKNTRAADANRIIQQLFMKPDAGTAPFTTSVDERTNLLIISCDPKFENLDAIEVLLLQIDSDPTPASNAVTGIPGASGGPPQSGLGSFSGVAVRGESIRNFSFSVDIAGQGAEELRARYQELERKSRELAARLRQPLPDPAAGDLLKQELHQTVQQAFSVRQQQQRAELAEFARRLSGIQQSIELRDRIRQQIIDRRVEELLNPNLGWEGTRQPDNGGPISFTRPASIVPGPAAQLGTAPLSETNQGTSPENSRPTARPYSDTQSTAATIRSLSSDAPDLILGKSPEELHELLARRFESLRQIRERIRANEDYIERGQDVEGSERALKALQVQLDEYSRKHQLAWQEYTQQVELLKVAVERDQFKLSKADTEIETGTQLVRKGVLTQDEFRQRQTAQQDARVALHRTEALLKLYRQAGEGFQPSFPEKPDPNMPGNE